MKKIICFFAMLISIFALSQTYSVTLKVIDETAGSITNNVNDNNESNIFCWIDDALSAQNPRTPSDWWYPMYNDAGATPTGNLIKTSESWQWTITLQATAGTYKWTPYAKTLGWQPINPNMYGYAGDDGNNLVFTVNADGSVSGHTELVIPDPSSQTKFPVTLKVIDYTGGVLSDAPGTWAQDANIITWVSGDLNDGGYWFYGMFNKTVDWDGAGNNYITFPRGLLVKDGGTWTWQATFEAAPGAYQWNPMNILLGYASLNGYGGASWEGENMTFTIGEDGTVGGTYIVELGKPIDVPMDKTRVACIGDSNTYGAGASNATAYSWPSQLQNDLPADYATHNFGVNGATLMNFPKPNGAWTNNEGYQYEYYKTYDANVILIALGTNDSKIDYWAAQGSSFQSQYLEFINTVKSFAAENPDIYMVLPIKAVSSAYNISNDNIENGVVPAINELSLDNGIQVIDWNTLTAAWTTAELPDGIHANDAALGIMAQKVADIILTEKPEILINSTNDTPVDAGYAEYRWYKDNELAASGAQAYSYTATQAGTYKLAVKLYADTDDVILSKNTITLTDNTPTELYLKGLNLATENSDKPSVKIYPNPAKDVLNIENLNVSGKNISAKIYDIGGNLVKNLNLNKTQINVSGLKKGVYVLKINDKTVKFIKE